MASCSRELINNRLFIVNKCDHDSYDLSAIYEHKHTYLNGYHTHIHVCTIVQMAQNTHEYGRGPCYGFSNGMECEWMSFHMASL